MIIDIHTHTFPDDLAPRAVARLRENAGNHPAYSDGTCAGLLAAMRLAGVDAAVLAPIATKQAQVRAINRWTVEMQRQYPGLIGFGTLYPAAQAWEEEIPFLLDAGIPGIKLHPDYQDFFVDDPAIMPMYQALAEAGIPVLLHAGVDIGLPPPVHCTPDRLARVLDAVPTVRIIAAHMGGYSMWDEVEQHLVGRDLYFDTSYSLADLGPARMATLIRAHGVHRVLFGTDSPWTAHAAQLNGIRNLGFTDEETHALLGENAMKLLAISSNSL